MSEKYTFVADLLASDWSAFRRDFKKGEIVTKFSGHTYGLDRDEAMYLDRETIPVNHPDVEGFFTCPVEFLIDEKGDHPEGAYLTRTKVAEIKRNASPADRSR